MVAEPQQTVSQAETPQKKSVPLPDHRIVGQSAFLTAYRGALIDAVAKSAPPIYAGPDSAPFVRLGLLKRNLKGAQVLSVLAGAMGIRGLKAHGDRPARRPVRGLGEIAEMSVGKTIIALATLAMADEGITGKIMPDDQRPIKSQFYPALFLVPPTLPEKWLREARDTLPTAKPVILRAVQTRDELRAFRQFDPSFTGTKLSSVACVDRVVGRIAADLAAWRRACADQRYQHWGIPQAEVERWRAVPRYPVCGIIPPADVTAWQEANATAQAEGRDVLPDERRRWERACRAKQEHTIVDPAAEQRWNAVVAEARTRRQQEVHAWKDACLVAVREDQPLPPRPGATPLRLPTKPAHIGVITYDGAKMGSAWRPSYVLRVLRAAGEGGRTTAIRDAETGEMVVVPCCPTCCAPVTRDETGKRRRTPKRKAEDDADEAVAQEEIEASPYVSEAELRGDDGKHTKYTCEACGDPLWQTIPDGARWQALPPPIMEAQQVVTEVTPYASIVGTTAPDVLDGLAQRQEELRPYVRPVQRLPIPDHAGQYPVLCDARSRKVPLADYLRKRYKGVFRSLVTDEAHKVAGSGTAQGFAAASLFDACGPGGTSVFMTGTLFSGYASGLFPLLWRLMPEIRTEFGYKDLTRWVDCYGVRQRITKVSEKTLESGARSKRRANASVPRELPGLSPLALQHLLPTCLFLELADVAPDLPPFTEEVITVPMGDALGRAYRQFEMETTAELKRLLWAGDNSATSPWFHSLMVYPNLPFKELHPTARRTNTVLGVSQVFSPQTIMPKEAEFAAHVRDARQRGRRVLVYVEHTQEHDLIPRLTHVLEHDDAQWLADDPTTHPGQPITVVALRSDTVPAIKREAWLNQQVEQGCDVIICHSGLVEVGLDLLAFPSIFGYEVIFSTSRLRQSTRRSWRIGQTVPVEVKYFVYENTMESRGLHLIATKMMSSLLIEGKLPSEGLAAEADISGSASLILELAKTVLSETDADAMATVADLRRSFLELQRVGQEQNGFIGDFVLTPLIEEPFVIDLLPVPVVPAMSGMRPLPVAAPPVQRTTWGEFRQQALHEAAERKARRRSRKNASASSTVAAPTAFPEGSLWSLLPRGAEHLPPPPPSRAPVPPPPPPSGVTLSQLSLFA